MGDDGGAQTGLVGKHAARHALFDYGAEGVAEDAAADSLEIKGILEDCAESRAQIADVHDDNDDGQDEEQDAHEGDEDGGDSADPLDAADDNESGHDGDDDADNQLDCSGVKVCEAGGQCAGDLVCLDGGHADCRQHAESGGEIAQPFPALAEALGYVIESAAGEVALLVLLAEVQTQDVFGVVGDHAEECGDPHPEHGAGAAGEDGGGDADDVARADGAGDGCGKGFKLGDGLCRFVLALLLAEALHGGDDGCAHGLAQLADLHDPCQDGEQNACAEDEDYHRPAPDYIVQPLIAFFDGAKNTFHFYFSLSVFEFCKNKGAKTTVQLRTKSIRRLPAFTP